MKDNFSTHSDQYRQFRPTYPQDLFDFIYQHCLAFEQAWDCGTGNGQAALELAKRFKKVQASDISAAQLAQAPVHERIVYSQQAAEKTDFPAQSFDLICVAQAIHWFDFERFYAEAKRVLQPGGVLAAIGYGLTSSIPALDAVILHYYQNILGPFWDAERKQVEQAYQGIPFPFEEIKTLGFSSEFVWRFEHLLGYLQTWSAAKHYQQQKGHNPLDLVSEDLKLAWGEEEKLVFRFPIFLRLGSCL
jgi:SAM-dependent methyltransferase